MKGRYWIHSTPHLKAHKDNSARMHLCRSSVEAEVKKQTILITLVSLILAGGAFVPTQITQANPSPIQGEQQQVFLGEETEKSDRELFLDYAFCYFFIKN